MRELCLNCGKPFDNEDGADICPRCQMESSQEDEEDTGDSQSLDCTEESHDNCRAKWCTCECHY